MDTFRHDRQKRFRDRRLFPEHVVRAGLCIDACTYRFHHPARSVRFRLPVYFRLAAITRYRLENQPAIHNRNQGTVEQTKTFSAKTFPENLVLFRRLYLSRRQLAASRQHSANAPFFIPVREVAT